MHLLLLLHGIIWAVRRHISGGKLKKTGIPLHTAAHFKRKGLYLALSGGRFSWVYGKAGNCVGIFRYLEWADGASQYHCHYLPDEGGNGSWKSRKAGAEKHPTVKGEGA